ncbi:MAG: lipopolysaccharide kinase InaA family protein [gamma proteobacterium symbiont of Bathyaustriella thionipta]|nr:lipopolysaccharide kinase InaA family protein [gamma proteobacterium symbiont of Bathyaustriella thionipta]MCU7949280.1 lipopolysaccharide kinase InaA family protein [gamma proteobacterium symbiont of Bathyaustriella thionipta]MCU7954006.1 lipopolysaccharide kinase InaA family protein [gamma proteobacterium symbiont of Bathyaustriella thionipta]MCU7955883.1 lipopolysaccharide kinase InaA family protein [gamma proteobacterium symbiont of Bathyaustriella thionipta]MCU7966854.1 lipopolysacchari
MKEAYFNTLETRQLLEHNKLASFDQLWALETPWFEEPNYRRNGWSGVVKHPLLNKNGQTIWVFIKRQENHNCKTLMHPLKGIPTFRREFINIKRLNEKQVPTLTTLYYAERSIDDKEQAILITLSLEGYQSLEEFCSNSANNDHPQRQAIMTLTGQVTRRMNDAHFCHNCLYPKHFFVKNNEETVDVRIIDLEKLKWLPFYHQIRHNDVSRIIRRGNPMTYDDIKIILSGYYHSGKHNLETSTLAQNLNQLLEKQTNP